MISYDFFLIFLVIDHGGNPWPTKYQSWSQKRVFDFIASRCVIVLLSLTLEVISWISNEYGRFNYRQVKVLNRLVYPFLGTRKPPVSWLSN